MIKISVIKNNLSSGGGLVQNYPGCTEQGFPVHVAYFLCLSGNKNFP